MELIVAGVLLLGVLLIVRLVVWNMRERAAERAWESQRPEAERFGHAVDAQIGRLLSPEGWYLNLGACTAGPDGFEVLYEHNFVQHEIWFEYNPRSGVAESRIPGWDIATAATHAEDEAVAFFASEARAAIDAPDGLRHLDDDV